MGLSFKSCRHPGFSARSLPTFWNVLLRVNIPDCGLCLIDRRAEITSSYVLLWQVKITAHDQLTPILLHHKRRIVNIKPYLINQWKNYNEWKTIERINQSINQSIIVNVYLYWIPHVPFCPCLEANLSPICGILNNI